MLTENRIAAHVHAIPDDVLFAILGCRLGISAAADHSGEGADARTQEGRSADRAGDRTNSTTADSSHARVFGDIRIVAGGTRRLLTRDNVAVVCRLGVATHVDDGPI